MLECLYESCSKTFDKQWKLDEHLYSHTGERPFLCEEPGCDKTFTRKCHLQRHQLTHSEDRPHRCKTCGSTFKLLANLRKHEKIHDGKKHPCSVQECHMTFVKKTQLYRHLKDNHGIATPFPCDICSANFTTKSHLTRHQNRSHFSHFMCTDCGETFDKFSVLNKHISKVHKRKKQCLQEDSHVEIVSSEEVILKKPGPAQNDVKPCPDDASGSIKPESDPPTLSPLSFDCDSCQQQFKSRTHLTIHLRDVHSKVVKKHFQCSECNSVFSHKPNLVSHMLSKHEGVKRFHCEQCPSQFYHKHSLARHVAAKHSGKERAPRTPWNKVSHIERLSGHIVDDRVKEYVENMAQLQETASS
uniref:Zf-C2H2 domain-containing protein n=1 Tax=Beroe forskalii TaxID=140453 RepID=V9PNY6_BERFR|nr:zf-C2H2 domain-containing protein [Beroe forskalii]